MKQPGTEFGRELRALRLAHDPKYSQAALARLVGVEPAYVSQLETGTRANPSPPLVRRLAGRLGVSPNYLFRPLAIEEMDLASTLVERRQEISAKLADLTLGQLEELRDFLAYLDAKLASSR